MLPGGFPAFMPTGALEPDAIPPRRASQAAGSNSEENDQTGLCDAEHCDKGHSLRAH